MKRFRPTPASRKNAPAFVRAANASSRSQRQFLLSFVLVSLECGGDPGYLLRRNVENTLGTEPETLRSMLARMADGDLATSTGSANARPDSVLAALGRMRLQMSQIVGQVRQASESIATGSTEIATGNSDLSVRTENKPPTCNMPRPRCWKSGPWWNAMPIPHGKPPIWPAPPARPLKTVAP